MSQYLTLVLSAAINYFDVRSQASLTFKLRFDVSGNSAASVLSFVILLSSLSSILITIVTAKKLSKLTDSTEVKAYQDKYGSLFEDLKVNKLSALLLTAVDQVRTVVTVAVLVGMTNFPGMQVMILFAVSQYRQFYLVLVKPYETAAQNYLALFNEILVSAYIYCFMALTEFTKSETVKLEASYGLLGILGIYIATNVLFFMTYVVKYVRLVAKK
jgi:hypothetical protein